MIPLPDRSNQTRSVLVFIDGRNRTSLWFEGGFAAKLNPSLTLTGKATQYDWLSSTGKSAYVESSAETGAAERYFPSRRDDWDSLLGVGATRQLSPHTLLTMDLLSQRAWSHLAAFFAECEFQRLVINLGATIKL